MVIRMKPRIVVCTHDEEAWESLARGCRAGGLCPERLTSMNDLAHLDGLSVSAVVVDDHFSLALSGMAHILAKRRAILARAAFLTISEALTAQWMGMLGAHDAALAGTLTDWAADARGWTPYPQS